MNTTKKIRFVVVISATVGILALGGTALAQTGPVGGFGGRGGAGMMRPGANRAPGVFGTVASVPDTSGTFTVTSKMVPAGGTGTATVYAVTTNVSTVITKTGVTSPTIANIAVGDTVMVTGTMSGQTITAKAVRDGAITPGDLGRGPQGIGAGIGMGQGIFGTVATTDGATTLTVTSKIGPQNATTATTYTVNASGATVTKNGATSTFANIAIGDTVMIQGTINGTTVTAKTIRDGLPQNEKPKQNDKEKPKQPAPTFVGNGQPIVGGKVTAITGNAITIATIQGNITYTVDATNATITKNGTKGTITSISVGDSIIAQGTVNGNSVTATSVIDSTKANTPTTASPSVTKKITGAIGGFFHKLFGFF